MAALKEEEENRAGSSIEAIVSSVSSVASSRSEVVTLYLSKFLPAAAPSSLEVASFAIVEADSAVIPASEAEAEEDVFL